MEMCKKTPASFFLQQKDIGGHSIFKLLKWRWLDLPSNYINASAVLKSITRFSSKRRTSQIRRTEAVGDVRLRNTAECKSLQDQMSECSNRTVSPFSEKDVQAYDCSIGGRMDGKKKIEATDVRAIVKEQVDKVGRSLHLTNLQGLCDQSNVSHLELSPGRVTYTSSSETPEFKEVSANWEERLDMDDHN